MDATIFKSFFEIGSAVGFSLLITIVLPTMFIYKKWIRR